MSKPTNKPKTVTIVVLNDGETFTDISGCEILEIPEDDYIEITRHGGDARDFTPSKTTSIESIYYFGYKA